MHPLIPRLAALAAALASVGPNVGPNFSSGIVPNFNSGIVPNFSSGARVAAGPNASAGIAPDVDPAPATGGRIVLVPLDDRPVSVQYPAALAAVADAALVMPPRGVLGRFLKTGDGDAVVKWLDALDLSTVDAVVVSADMVAYGGLVGSRVGRVFEADARRRIDAIARVRQRRSGLPVYVFSTIMRLAPTDDGGNRGWREQLSRWAEISPASSDPSVAAEVVELERTLPAGMLDRYKAARARNLAVNLRLVDLCATGAIDHLVFGQDDAKPSGVHVADRTAIENAIRGRDVDQRASVQPGADEIAMLLVTRALLAHARAAPAVHVTYSSAADADAVMPFEDRPLKETVAAHVRAAGGRLVTQPAAGALQFFVYTSRHQSPDPAQAFAGRIGKALDSGARAAVADVDTRGDVQGASLAFTEALRGAQVLRRLSGYASWNTAGNTVGIAVSHGLIASHAADLMRDPSTARRISDAQLHALVLRLTNDFLYQGVVRGQAMEDIVRARGLEAARLDEHGKARVEKYLHDEIRPLVEGLLADFAVRSWRLPGASARGRAPAMTVKELEQFEISLPWSRMFEADITLKIGLADQAAAPKPPPPRVLR